MTYCVKCGAKADDGDIFCRSCGAKIVRSAAGSSHGPAVSSPRTDGAAVTDKKENSNEGKTQETELGTEQKPAADRGAPSEEGGVSAGQAGGAVPKEHQGRGSILRTLCLSLMLLSVPAEILLPFAIFAWSEESGAIAVTESAAVTAVMAAALFLDRKKGLPLLILASYALAAGCTVSFASSGYPGQIAAIVSAMLDGLSTEAAMSVFISERGMSGACLLLGIHAFRVIPLVLFPAEYSRVMHPLTEKNPAPHG